MLKQGPSTLAAEDESGKLQTTQCLNSAEATVPMKQQAKTFICEMHNFRHLSLINLKAQHGY